MIEPELTLEWAASVTGGHLEGVRFEDISFSRVVIDSREDVRGALFIALKGERFDGHKFIEEVIEKGVAAVMVESSAAGCNAPRIVIEDTLEGLQALAAAHRGSFSGVVASITGSSGKTTTRRILTSIMSQRCVTHEPKRNFNNHIGVPLTLLELTDKMEAAVLELGCSDFGEIALLTRLADPDVAMVTNVGPAHLEKLVDLDGVAKAKGEMFAGMKQDSIAVINLDDQRVAAMDIISKDKVTYGRSSDADVHLISRKVMEDGSQSVHMSIHGVEVCATLPLLGDHNTQNAVAGAAMAMAMGASLNDVQYGLATVPVTSGRLEVLRSKSGAMIIDDTYNANPASTAAALRVLCELPGGAGKIAVLSDMLELGDSFESAHRDLGRKAAEMKLKFLITMGEGGALIHEGALIEGMSDQDCHHVRSHEEAARTVLKIIEPSDAVLIKGSRGARMEEVVKRLVKEVS